MSEHPTAPCYRLEGRVRAHSQREPRMLGAMIAIKCARWWADGMYVRPRW